MPTDTAVSQTNLQCRQAEEHAVYCPESTFYQKQSTTLTSLTQCGYVICICTIYVTFPHLLVLYLSTGDLIGLGLLIFLQLLGILHLLPLCLIKVALQKHMYCYAVQRGKLYLCMCTQISKLPSRIKLPLKIVLAWCFSSNIANGEKQPRHCLTLQTAKRLKNKVPPSSQCLQQCLAPNKPQQSHKD